MTIHRNIFIVCSIILLAILLVFVLLKNTKKDDTIEFRIVPSDKEDILFTASSSDVSNHYWRPILVNQLLKVHSSDEIQIFIKFYLDAEHFSIVQDSYKISFATPEYMKIYRHSSDSWSEIISIPLQKKDRENLVTFKNDIAFLLDRINETISQK